MRRKDVEDCEYLTIYLFINKVHCGLKICHFIIKKSEAYAGRRRRHGPPLYPVSTST